jgi:hypothetical protein
MDVSGIVTRLLTVGSLGQVVTADPAGSPVNYDSSTALYGLLNSLVSQRMYPLTQREDPVQPSIVYQLIGSAQGNYDGFAITQTDTFVLTVKATGYDALFDLVGSIKTTMAASALAIETTDLMFDYEDEAQLFSCAMQVELTYMCSASQTLPAVYVYSLGRSAQSSAFDNITKQRVNDDYGILICTINNDLPALAADIRARLLGWQQSAAHFEMEYASGSQVAGVGGLRLWRETYTDSVFITEV